MGIIAIMISSYSVQLDPKFSQQSTPLSYFTTNTMNHTQRQLLYNTNHAGWNVIAWYEPIEQNGTIGEILILGILVLLSRLTHIIPNRIFMLLVVG